MDLDAPLSSLVDKLCRAVEVVKKLPDGTEKKRRYRALRPFDPEEVRLLEMVERRQGDKFN
jgi:hypothetical protein